MADLVDQRLDDRGNLPLRRRAPFRRGPGARNDGPSPDANGPRADRARRLPVHDVPTSPMARGSLVPAHARSPSSIGALPRHIPPRARARRQRRRARCEADHASSRRRSTHRRRRTSLRGGASQAAATYPPVAPIAPTSPVARVASTTLPPSRPVCPSCSAPPRARPRAQSRRRMAGPETSAWALRLPRLRRPGLGSVLRPIPSSPAPPGSDDGHTFTYFQEMAEKRDVFEIPVWIDAPHTSVSITPLPSSTPPHYPGTESPHPPPRCLKM